MAWIRTSLSMISLGFTIYKFSPYLAESAEGLELRQGPLNLGRVMVVLGVLLLVAGHRPALAVPAGAERAREPDVPPLAGPHHRRP
jgi:uncharacterized membrane protein YidH (DUF202 family)